MTVFNNWLSGFGAAWEMLIDLPLPRRILQYTQKKVPTSTQTAAGFPLIGILLGLALALLCGLLNASWINSYVSAGLFAAAAVYISESKDSARGLRLLVSVLRRKSDGSSWIDSTLTASAADHSLEKGLGNLFVMLIILLEFIGFSLLAFYHASLWCVAVFAGAFTIQMLFATLPRNLDNLPYLPVSSSSKKSIWILPLLTGIVLLLFFPAAAIATAAIVGGLGSIIHKNFLMTSTPVTSDLITLSGKITELILLFAGLIFIL